MFSRISGWYRLLTVFSIVWVVYWLLVAFGNHHRVDFYAIAIIPPILLWGIIWIIKGFKGEEANRLDLLLQEEEYIKKSKKIYCPICGEVFSMATGKPNSDGIIICPKCI